MATHNRHLFGSSGHRERKKTPSRFAICFYFPRCRRPNTRRGPSLVLVDTDVFTRLVIHSQRVIGNPALSAGVDTCNTIASELGTEFSLSQEPAAMHQISLERVKEGLHVSIVPWSSARSCSDRCPRLRGDHETVHFLEARSTISKR
jgi:hypothetical protein